MIKLLFFITIINLLLRSTAPAWTCTDCINNVCVGTCKAETFATITNCNDAYKDICNVRNIFKFLQVFS